jgi:DNA-binding response OmpR family regulator
MDQEQATTEQGGRKVLIIEDEYFISELYVRALKRAGYQVDLTIDGAIGLQKAQTDDYDIILLDIMVPTITGTEILEKLRDKAEEPIRAKIIVTTNLEQSEENKAAIERQADAYIIKAEITPKQLVEFLNSVG